MLNFMAKGRAQLVVGRQCFGGRQRQPFGLPLAAGQRAEAYLPKQGFSRFNINQANWPGLGAVETLALTSQPLRTFLKKNRGDQQGERRTPPGGPEQRSPGAGGAPAKRFARAEGPGAGSGDPLARFQRQAAQRYGRFSRADFVKNRDDKLQAFLESLSAAEREEFAARNRKLMARKPVDDKVPESMATRPQGGRRRLSAEDAPDRSQTVISAHASGVRTRRMDSFDASGLPEVQKALKQEKAEAAQQERMLSKATGKAAAEATVAVEAASEHLGDTFAELNRRLLTYQQGSSSEPDAALELFQAEKEELFARIESERLLLELTPRGRQVQRLREVRDKFDKNGEQWTAAEVDAFVSEYLNIYSKFIQPVVHAAEISEFLERPVAAEEASTNQLVNDFHQIAAAIAKQTRTGPKAQPAGTKKANSKERVLEPAFLQDVRAELAAKSKYNTAADVDKVHRIVQQYMANRGLLAMSAADEAAAARLLGTKDGSLGVGTKSSRRQGGRSGAGQTESARLPLYQKHMRSVLFDELKLDQSPRFKAFVADIAINTVDLRDPVAAWTHATAPREEGLGSQDLLQVRSQFRLLEHMSGASAAVSIPVLDRFLNLILSLHEPNFYKGIKYSEQDYATELGLAYGLHNDEKAAGYNLIHDPEYMLRYQVLALAKFHNFFGQMDQYMKEFARICVETGNQKLIKNLERVLNVEVSIVEDRDKVDQGKLLKMSDEMQVEVDPLVLAQPRFRFSAVGDKMKMIQNYQDLIKDQERTREAIRLLEKSTQDPKVFAQLTKDFAQLFKLIEEFDRDNSNSELRLDGQLGTIEKLKKTSAYIDESIRNAFLRLYGVDGIGFANMEDVYAPLVSGLGSMQRVREHLLGRGMSPQFADLLAAKYIKKQEETAAIVTLIDFFDTSKDGFKAMKLLAETDLKDVCLNYSTLGSYSELLNRSEQFKVVRALSKDKSLHAEYLPPQRIQPVRPNAFQRRSGLPGMSSMLSGSLQMRTFSEDGQRGKFFDFLAKAAQTDKKVQEQQESAKVEAAEEQSAESDHVSKEEKGAQTAERAPQDVSTEAQAANTGAAQAETAAKVEAPPMSAREVKEMARAKLIKQAVKKYNIEFFKQFSFSGQDALKLSQKGLEQYIIALEDAKEVELLLLAMIHQAYRLNEHIPNIELLLYKMFCSPIATKELRKEVDDKVKLLAGNIFAEKGMSMHSDVYRSLLETLTMRPNKKHFKKIVAYIRQYEKKEDVDPMLIDQIVSIGIDQRYPVTLGQLVRDFIAQEDYNIHKTTFMKFLMFMERSKGFEEDAKKFMILSLQSSSIQIDYEMIRPFVQRTMKKKGGQEIIKFFEQVRKSIKLNQSWDGGEPALRAETLQRIRKDFFDGLIKDLMRTGNHTLAEVVMDEKGKEKFPVKVEDDLLALEIYASQLKMPNYREKFQLFFDTDNGSAEYELAQEATGILAKTLMSFEGDEFKNERLMLTEQLNKKMANDLIPYEAEVFHSICHVYVESQEWGDVAAFLRKQTRPDLCRPSPKTVKFLKQNLAYIFQATVRQDLQDAVAKFEHTFFSLQGAQNRRAEEAARKRLPAQAASPDEITEGDLNEGMDHLGKKAMRREVRKAERQRGDEQDAAGNVQVKQQA